MSTKSRPSPGPGEGGTVLIRQAQPKYNFKGKKLPKETTKPVVTSNPNTPSSLTNSVSQNASSSVSPSFTSSSHGKPVAVVGASVQARPSQPDSGTAHTSTSHLANVKSMPDLNHQTLNPSVTQSVLPKSVTSNNLADFPVPSMSKSSSTWTLPGSTDDQNPSANESACGELPGAAEAAATVLTTAQEVAALRARTKAAEAERDRAARDLQVQLQVNAELKKLLVASVGDDLAQRVERLSRDRAELSQDLGGFSKKMNEDYENFDKVSIQADMWRSKYLASRVMVEELGSARAWVSLQLHEAQEALQQLLHERHELRTYLMDNYRVLSQVKKAFDPLNASRSSILATTHVLELGRACQGLAESVRFRLLPAGAAGGAAGGLEDDLPWEACVTPAERLAHEVLSRPCDPPGSFASGAPRLPITSGPPAVSRFHPHTRDMDLTMHSCKNCKGEITVL